MSLYILTHPLTQRLQTLLGMYGSVLISDPRFSFSFVNGPSNITHNIPISPHFEKLNIKGNPNINPMQRIQLPHMLKSFATAAEDFLAHSYNEWFYRGTDDSFINVTNLKFFMEELEKGPNPLEHPLVYGNCVVISFKCFLHGGSGYVLSRAAVQLLLRHKRQFFNCGTTDDSCFNDMIKIFGLNTYNASSPYFSGLDIHNNETTLVSCLKERKVNTGCRYHIFPASRVAFYHGFGDYVEKAKHFTKIWSLPPDIYLNNFPTERRLCIFNKNDTIPNHPRIPNFYRKDEPEDPEFIDVQVPDPPHTSKA